MQSPEIASLRPEHHAVQGFARNDSLGDVNLFRPFTTVSQFTRHDSRFISKESRPLSLWRPLFR
jgi:hypothetical protein